MTIPTGICLHSRREADGSPIECGRPIHAKNACRRCYDRTRRTRQARITALPTLVVHAAARFVRYGRRDVAEALMRDVFEMLEVAG